jgi:predicted membrane protein
MLVTDKAMASRKIAPASRFNGGIGALVVSLVAFIMIFAVTDMADAAPASRFHGESGALIVSLIAFTIVFSVLAALSATIFINRYIAMIVEKKDKGAKTASSASAPSDSVAAPVSQTASDVNDMKKVVAAISAAINASVGGSVNIISVTPAQSNCSSMNQMWRTTGIAECMASRL